jgi:hypothetical protein
MTRSLGELDADERELAVQSIQLEAERAGWRSLSNQRKSVLYQEWSHRYDLKRTAIKDQVMKGFDAAQHIPPSGEAAVHERLKTTLAGSAVPHWDDKVTSWSGRGAADFVLGFSSHWVVMTAELESAANWQAGLMQALWYRSAYFNETGLQALPALVLFGDMTSERWNEIRTTCLGLGVLLLGFELRVDGAAAPKRIDDLLRSFEQGS